MGDRGALGSSANSRANERDYEARHRAEELGLAENELVVTREELEAIRDRMFVLACAVEDVERDLANGDADDAAGLVTLLDAAREFVNVDEPVAVS